MGSLIVPADLWHINKFNEFLREYQWSAFMLYHYAVHQAWSNNGFVPNKWYGQIDDIASARELVSQAI